MKQIHKNFFCRFFHFSFFFFFYFPLINWHNLKYDFKLKDYQKTKCSSVRRSHYESQINARKKLLLPLCSHYRSKQWQQKLANRTKLYCSSPSYYIYILTTAAIIGFSYSSSYLFVSFKNIILAEGTSCIHP